MKKSTALKSVFIISIAGILFSGYLSFTELFAKTCPLGGCSFVLGMPACVYGLIMYLIVGIVSLLGIMSKE